MARVWHGTLVDESNLKVQVAALRRALRDGEKDNRYIFTVPGRGYWFVAPVLRSAQAAPHPRRRRGVALADRVSPPSNASARPRRNNHPEHTGGGQPTAPTL